MHKYIKALTSAFIAFIDVSGYPLFSQFQWHVDEEVGY